MRLIVAIGARPNMVKVGPLLPEFTRAGIDFDVALVSSRTREREESGGGMVSFFGVDLFRPRWFLQAQGGGQSADAGPAMVAFEGLFGSERPDAVFVVGDSAVSLAAAVTAARFGISVVHLDAGLRCGDLRVAEEMNRVVISRVAAMHLTPTEGALENLEDEGIEPERIHFVGSMMAESVSRARDEFDATSATAEFGVVRSGYVLASIHRPENLHDASRLGGILGGLERAAIPVIAPDSGDLRRAIERHALSLPENVRAVEAVSYHTMLALQCDAGAIVTDSGGVQIEACTLGTPCLTVLPCTEQAETIAVGANETVAAAAKPIASALAAALATPRTWATPQRWDRAVSDRVVRALKRGIMPLA